MRFVIAHVRRRKIGPVWVVEVRASRGMLWQRYSSHLSRTRAGKRAQRLVNLGAMYDAG